MITTRRACHDDKVVHNGAHKTGLISGIGDALLRPEPDLLPLPISERSLPVPFMVGGAPTVPPSW